MNHCYRLLQSNAVFHFPRRAEGKGLSFNENRAVVILIYHLKTYRQQQLQLDEQKTMGTTVYRVIAHVVAAKTKQIVVVERDTTKDNSVGHLDRR